MRWRIAEIARAMDAPFAGDGDVAVTGLAEPQHARADQLALAMSPQWTAALTHGHARSAVLAEGTDHAALGLDAAIFVKRARFAMVPLTRLFGETTAAAPGISATALVDDTAEIADSAQIGPFAVIGPGCKIGANSVISAHVSLARDVEIGTACVLFDGCRIGPNCLIGDRSVIHHNAIVGSEGFSFVTEHPSGVEVARASLGAEMRVSEGGWQRIYALGGVTIGEEVEIGANATVDAGTIRPTRIGDRTKIDNLVHVAHNVTIGKDCLICAQSGIAGSSQIGDRVVLGGQCGVSDNIRVGDDVIAGGSTKIFTNQPSGRAILGSPAVRMETQIAINKAVRRLPRLAEKLQKLVSKPGTND